jgi:hypothetical protein
MVSFRRGRPRGTPPLTTATDPLQLLRRHAGALAAAARQIRAQVGDADLAGVIVTPGASHGDALRRLLRECHGDADAGHVCIGVVPTERLGDVLAGSRTEVAEASTQSSPVGIAIVVDTPSGLRVVPWLAGGDSVVPME